MGFEDFDVETNTEAKARVCALYDGKIKLPTVMVGNDFIKNLTVPQFNEFLKKTQYRLEDILVEKRAEMQEF